MKYKNLAFALGVGILGSFVLLVSCKKINDYTTLGGDLVPEVDGINTFDTILDIQAYNDTFSKTTDTTLYSTSYDYYLGRVDNDPLFGKTDARISLELKPAAYRYTFSGRPDSLHIDSVVLVLDYAGSWGDTNTQQTVNVFEMGSELRSDTTNNVREYNITQLAQLGTRTFYPRDLKDTINAYQDTTGNTLRIRLDDAFGARLLNYDTTTANGRVAAYISDTAFTQAFKGFTLQSTGGNALMAFNLTAANTKLAIYYKDDNGDLIDGSPTPNWDTAVAYFTFAGNTSSAAAQFVKRDLAGTQLAAQSDGVTGTPDNEIYMLSTPGSFATLKIPALAGLSNRIVHRAEIIMDQIYSGITDSLFSPTNLYIDAYDPTLTSVTKFRTIPYDVVYGSTTGFNLSAFGVVPYSTADEFSNPIKEWRFNVTRYVQNVVNGTIATPYDLRLTEPLSLRNQYSLTPTSASETIAVNVNGAVGKGRVRLHGTGDGSQPSPNPRRMRMRIVYSKL